MGGGEGEGLMTVKAGHSVSLIGGKRGQWVWSVLYLLFISYGTCT